MCSLAAGYRATLRLEQLELGTLIRFTLEARVPRPLQRRVAREVQTDIERLARLAGGDGRA